MKRSVFLGGAALVLVGAWALAAAADQPSDWAMNATAIEACSCPMFCQCYFSPHPATHHDAHGQAGHFCRFNMGYKVNRGHHGATKLDGAKFWLAGDLGAEFGDGEMDWAVLTFDPAVTPEQRAGISAALGALFPVKWKSFTVAADAPIDWQASEERAVAKLGGGKVGEVVLVRPAGSATGAGPVVIKNLKYWGAPRNDGFVLMPNEVEAYRAGDKAFEYRGTNGFMITVDLAARDAGASK